MTATAGPVYGEYIPATQQLVVSNYDGNTITVIDVSLDEYGNDSPTFGTTFTIPVGTNPSSVTALADGSRAYTSNQTDGTVTIVNLLSHTVEKTLTVVGHPRTVVSTSNSLFGKVYVASPDSPYLTIIRTDQDIVDTTVLVEGNIVDVRVSTQNRHSREQQYIEPPARRRPALLPAGDRCRNTWRHARRCRNSLRVRIESSRSVLGEPAGDLRIGRPMAEEASQKGTRSM